MTSPAQPLAPRNVGSTLQPTEPRRLHSHEILGSSQEALIIHRSQCYRLRITSLGKLILTK
jgi:hemin uptake protein HemP